jgi:uroporphyrinogen decarboxylase
MPDWTKRKRLEATIAGEASDRPPVAIWRHWPGDDQDAAALAAAHLKWQQDYDWDFVKVSPASSFCLVDWGVRDRWAGSAEGTREYTNRAIQHPDDWGKLPILDPHQGMLATQLEALRLVGQGLGSDVPFIATLFSPLAQAKNLAGEETMLEQMRRNPNRFRKGLAIITESTIRYLEAAKATGISGVFYAIQHCRYGLMSPAEYRLFGRPYDEEILAAASDLWLNMTHIHGEGIIFDLAADYPVQLVNWHDRESGVSLAEGLKQVSGAVNGGVSRWTLHQDNPEATTAEIQDAFAQTGRRRLVLGTGCVIMTNTPLRNIRALRNAV